MINNDEENYKYKNEEEIKKNCKIKIDNNLIPFSYYYQFKQEGIFKIKYIFINNMININHMFYDCKYLVKINLFNFNFEYITNMNSLFSYCESISFINLNNVNIKNVTDISNLFLGCKNLEYIDIPFYKIENIKY